MAVTRSIQLRTSVPGPRSREIMARKERSIAAALVPEFPIFVADARGATLTDVDGNTFIDFCGGIGALNVKDFVAFGRGPSLSIAESAKPGFYARVRRIVQAENLAAALGGAVVLAVLVNLIELACTAGLPAVYTRILTLHPLSTAEYYAHLALYNVAYVFDDAVMLSVAVVGLGRRKLQERAGRWLKLLSGSVMLVLGVALLAGVA